MRDMIQKGRSVGLKATRSGRKSGKYQGCQPVTPRKLTDEQVAQIRTASSAGLGYKRLAKQFGVHHATIYKIIKHKTYNSAA